MDWFPCLFRFEDWVHLLWLTSFFSTIVSKLYWSSISNNTHHHVHISFDIPNECFSIKWISFYYSKSESRPDGIPGISRRRELVTVSNIPNWTCMCVCECLLISSLFGSRNLFMQIHQCKTILFTFSVFVRHPTNKRNETNQFIYQKQNMVYID